MSNKVEPVPCQPSSNYLGSLAVRYKTAISSLNELAKDAALVKHRRTFEDLGKALSRLIESDYKWSLRCKKLEEDLSDAEVKVKTALQLSEEDKHVIDTLKEELSSAWKLIDQLKEAGENELQPEVNPKTFAELKAEKDSLASEVEKAKLQVFELEEELTNKEKLVEDAESSLSSKEAELEGMQKENEQLKAQVAERSKQQAQGKGVDKLESEKNRQLLKQLQDVGRRDEEKLQLLVKRNSCLCRQLQKAKSYANLLKVQLASQAKMLDLLTTQHCKLEEKDQKQTRIINELEDARSRLVSMTGHLELELHEMRKRFTMLCQIQN